MKATSHGGSKKRPGPNAIKKSSCLDPSQTLRVKESSLKKKQSRKKYQMTSPRKTSTKQLFTSAKKDSKRKGAPSRPKPIRGMQLYRFTESARTLRSAVTNKTDKASVEKKLTQNIRQSPATQASSNPRSSSHFSKSFISNGRSKNASTANLSCIAVSRMPAYSIMEVSPRSVSKKKKEGAGGSAKTQAVQLAARVKPINKRRRTGPRSQQNIRDYLDVKKSSEGRRAGFQTPKKGKTFRQAKLAVSGRKFKLIDEEDGFVSAKTAAETLRKIGRPRMQKTPKQ